MIPESMTFQTPMNIESGERSNVDEPKLHFNEFNWIAQPKQVFKVYTIQFIYSFCC